MKYCIYCGTAAGDEAKFCPKCGKKLDYGTPGAVQGNGPDLSGGSHNCMPAREPGSGNTGADRQKKRITSGFIILFLVLAAFFIVSRNKIRLPSIDFDSAVSGPAETVLNEENEAKPEGNPENIIRIPAE